MKAFVITLAGHPYSEAKARRCIETAAEIGGITVERFDAVDSASAKYVMERHGLRWTWAKENAAPDVCPITGLAQRPYGKLLPKIGCAMSHYLLWKQCAELYEPFLILEHDAVFIRPLPTIEFRGICQINDPTGATPHGKQWAASMRPGVRPKTKVFPDDVPDGLAGNSAYLVKPFAAQELIDAYSRLGVWPNDATMCRQLFPYLEEYSPFVTKVEQSISTTSQ